MIQIDHRKAIVSSIISSYIDNDEEDEEYFKNVLHCTYKKSALKTMQI